MYDFGLVLEGGGNRAVYTSGVLDAFMEKNIEFPYVIGVSAGSCNGVSYIAKCHRRQHDIAIAYSGDKRYMGFSSLLKTGEFLNGSWIFGELSYDLSPLDQKTYDESNTVMCVVVTNAMTGKAEYMYPDNMHERGCPILRASCSLPGATKGTKIGKDMYFDGGITDSIPFQRAFEDGCKKTVVILTRDAEYVKQPIGHPKLIKKMLKDYPLVADGVLKRHEMYNKQRSDLHKAEQDGRAFVIAPSAPLRCSTLVKDADKLEQIYQIGYNDALKQMDKLKEFLKS